MSERITKTKLTHDAAVKTWTFLIYTGLVLFTILTFFTQFYTGGILDMKFCMAHQETVPLWIWAILNIPPLIFISLALISIYHDIKLVLLIKNFNKIQPVEMTNWSVPFNPTRQDLNTVIPVRSSLIGIAYFLLSSCCSLIILLADFETSYTKALFIKSYYYVSIAFYLPIVLRSSIKQNKVKRQILSIKPPSNLQGVICKNYDIMQLLICNFL